MAIIDKKEIEKASVKYQMATCPMAIGGDAFADLVYKCNINPAFIAGAEWAIDKVIEGAYEWLRENAGKYSSIENCEDDDGVEFVFHKRKLVEDFKEAMSI